MNHLVLHIGRHKTGTTAIQWDLVDHDYPGLCYPRSGRVRPDGRVQPGHHTLARTLQDPESEWAGSLRRIRSGIRREAHGSEVIVLSSEGFQNLDRTGIERVARFVESLRPDRFTIVCYLREYLAYAASAFQQSAQSNPGVHDFIAYAEGVGDIDIEVFVADWRRIGDVVLRPYDRTLLEGSDAVTDFLSLLDREPLRDPSTTVDRNPSISGNLLLTKVVLNHANRSQLPDYNALRRVAAANERFRGPFRITDEDAAALRSRSRYVAGMATLMPGLPVRSFAEDHAVPEIASLEHDLREISAGLGLGLADQDIVRSGVATATTWFSRTERGPER